MGWGRPKSCEGRRRLVKYTDLSITDTSASESVRIYGGSS
jgi:hypothetical protein